MLSATYQYDKSCLYDRAVLLPFISDTGNREAAVYDQSCRYLSGAGLGAGVADVMNAYQYLGRFIRNGMLADAQLADSRRYSGSTAGLIIGGAAMVIGIAAILTSRK
jgi:hypothetical protein